MTQLLPHTQSCFRSLPLRKITLGFCYLLLASWANVLPAQAPPVPKEKQLFQQAELLQRQAPDSAIRLAGEVLHLALDKGADSLVAETYLLLGRLYHRQGAYDQSGAFLEKALLSWKQQQNHRGIIRTYSNLGILARKSGKYESALNWFQRGLDLIEEEDLDLQAQLLTNLGTLHGRLQQAELAIPYFRKAHPLYQSLNDSLGLAILANNLGNQYYELGQLDQAEQHYLEALFLYQELDDQRRLGHSFGNLGNLSVRKGDWTMAAEHYHAALRIAQQQQEWPTQVHIGTELGHVMVNNGQREAAHQLWRELLPLSQELGDAETEAQLLRYLSESLYEGGDATAAYLALQQATRLNDSLQEAYVSQQIAELDTKYRFESKERALMESRLALDQARQRQYVLIGSVVLLLMTLALAASLLRGYQRRQRGQQKLLVQREQLNRQLILDLLKEQEVESLNAMLEGKDQERQRIAADLHDSLGGTLAAVKVSLFTLQKKMDPDSSSAIQAYEHTRQLLEEAYKEVRRISHDLADNGLHPQGLAESIRALCETLQTHASMEVQWETAGLADIRLSNQQEVQLYRIVQELFHNIIKHAHASRVSLQISLHRDRLNLLVEDNGQGFAYDPDEPGNGLGLHTIRQRVKHLKGTIEIDSQPSQGTTIIIDLPR